MKNFLFGKRLIILVGVLLTVTAAPVGILALHQYRDAQADTETVDYDKLKSLIDPNRAKDPVKLNANDKISIPTAPNGGIAYQLESLHLDTSTGETTVVSEGVARLYLPATDTHDDKAVLGDNDMAIYRGTNYDIALDATENGFASYIVALNENAPTDYEFEVDLPSGYKLSEDGNDGIEILNEDSDVVGSIRAPWAVDANGYEIATVYKLRGDRLVQTLEHAGAEYPVVADPSLSFGWGIYLRWNLSDDTEGTLEEVGDLNQIVQSINCVAGISAATLLGGAGGLTSGQVALILVAVGLGAAYCETSQIVEEDVQDALDEIDDDLPPEWFLPDDCTLMTRHNYAGFFINKVQVEDCSPFDDVYYDFP